MLDHDQEAGAAVRTRPYDGSARRDRRRQPRQLALLRVALLRAGRADDICVVKNISPNGLSARIYRKVTAGESVEIELRSGQILAGSVVWQRGWDVGIAFAEPIDVAAVVAGRAVADTKRRRAVPRINVECPGRLSTGLRSFEIMLQDISQGGASVRSEIPVPEMCNVLLCLPDLPPVSGVARWNNGKTVGISFNECVAFERLARWIQMRREQAARDGTLRHR